MLRDKLPPYFPTRGAIQRKWLIRVVLLAAILGLLYFALRNAPLAAIRETLARLRVWQIALVLSMDALVYALISARWWLIVRADNKHTRYPPLFSVRLAVFGISYFTIGPQVGGEPLQVLYLRRRRNMTYARATASVLLDKLLELVANFMLLLFGLTAVSRSGILQGFGRFSAAGMLVLVGLVAWPAVHIILLRTRHYPVSAILGRLGRFVPAARLQRFVRASERLAGQFCQRHPRALLAALAVSLLAGASTVVEYAFILSCLSVRLPFWQTVAAWTAGWLSFLVPLPGGLGALEASQVLALGVFGVSAAAAISVTLVLRSRDLLLGGLGLLLAGRETMNFKSILRTADVLGDKDTGVRTTLSVQESSSAWEENHE
jgi:hypothetical protein